MNILTENKKIDHRQTPKKYEMHLRRSDCYYQNYKGHRPVFMMFTADELIKSIKPVNPNDTNARGFAQVLKFYITPIIKSISKFYWFTTQILLIYDQSQDGCSCISLWWITCHLGMNISRPNRICRRQEIVHIHYRDIYLKQDRILKKKVLRRDCWLLIRMMGYIGAVIHNPCSRWEPGIMDN